MLLVMVNNCYALFVHNVSLCRRIIYKNEFELKQFIKIYNKLRH